MTIEKTTLEAIDQDLANGMTAKESMQSLNVNADQMQNVLKEYLEYCSEREGCEILEEDIITGFEEE